MNELVQGSVLSWILRKHHSVFTLESWKGINSINIRHDSLLVSEAAGMMTV